MLIKVSSGEKGIYTIQKEILEESKSIATKMELKLFGTVSGRMWFVSAAISFTPFIILSSLKILINNKICYLNSS